MHLKPKQWSIALVAMLPTYAMAQIGEQTDPTSVFLLPEVVVYAQRSQALSSGQTYDSDYIKHFPSSNGNISDYLKLDPHVRFAQSDQSGLQQGEIRPESISINGADPSQTTYFIDNVNTNNDLGFGNDIFSGDMATVPMSSHEQAYFFDANLLSSVTVYDSDISASLGGFSGGAVVAKTKQFSGENGIKINYRTTRSSWAQLKVTDADKEAFEKAIPVGSTAAFQPRYTKNFFNLSLERRITDQLGMVFGYSQRNSHIKQNRLLTPQGDMAMENHTRRSDNALLNFNWNPSQEHRVELGLRYSNYRESKFYSNQIQGQTLDNHNAYGATLASINQFRLGKLTTTVAYDEFIDKRRASDTTLKTYIDADSGLEYSMGGMGDSQLSQKNLHLSSEFAFNAFHTGPINHDLSLGVIYQHTKYRFKRDDNARGEIYMSDYANPGHYMLLDSNEARQGSVTASYHNTALYIEDLLTWKWFEFRPGIRLERDDYLKNTNFAPRFVAKYHPWENTTLSAGWNRYFGRSFASMKLSEEIFKLDGHDSVRYQSLKSFKTPYSDELSLGFKQGLGNVEFNARYILRNNRNRIVLGEKETPEGDTYHVYEKGSDYKSNVYTLQLNTIEPWQLGPTQWSSLLAFDYLDTHGIDYGKGHTLSAPVVLDGHKMSYEQMMKKINNNQEDWTVRFGLNMEVPDYHFVWSNSLVLKAPINTVERLDSDDDVDVYRRYNYGKDFQWDTSFQWNPTIYGHHKGYIKVDILNVLNRTRKGIGRYGEDLGFYTPGREFWLEVGYEY